MRQSHAFALAGLVLVLPIAASSAQSLRQTMHAWKRHTRSLVAMATSRASFNEAAARSDLQALLAGASGLQVRLNSGTAEARDFRARFATLAAAASSTVSRLGDYAAFQMQVANIQSTCAACHDKYGN